MSRARGWQDTKFLLKVRWRALLRQLDRRHLRSNEIALTVLGVVLGAAIGIGVVIVRQLSQWLHQMTFHLPPDHLLSEGIGLAWWRVLIVPCIGGLVVGITTLVIRRFRPREVVDAIEANALYGGKMSLIDSANLTILTLLSGGFGASVGLEAAYTQMGAGFASNVGEVLRSRRNDMRTLVGCGAAAAIAAAFNAPLAGAFYAFELVIGSYSPAVLAPVSGAALAATFVERLIGPARPIFFVSESITIGGWDYPLFGLLGVLAAGIGIATMICVTWVERGFRRNSIPVWARSIIGGVAVGLIAFFWPQVLGSGHGAIEAVIANNFPPLALALLLPAKALASALSVGSGFRGGLFSSSLFLGSIFGAAAGAFLAILLPGLGIDRLAYTIVGMGTMAAAIVGAPVTMILLTLEMTANFYVTIGVTVGVIVASTIVRSTFGYSFATWRFHLRGVPIRGALDIGWIRDLTVRKLMRRDIHTVSENLPLAELRAQCPLGGTKRVFLLDANGDYAGMVVTADAHNPDLDERMATLRAADLRQAETQFLLPHQNVRAALDRFVNAEVEALPVLASATDRKVIGFVTEAYALRRYNQELEQARGEEFADPTLFGPA
ncbi:MAG: chloride channel protein [Alphaproteobacteria bacterium]|nr:chloride channel protein [Alphaproteobacteria bacterium]